MHLIHSKLQRKACISMECFSTFLKKYFHIHLYHKCQIKLVTVLELQLKKWIAQVGKILLTACSFFQNCSLIKAKLSTVSNVATKHLFTKHWDSELCLYILQLKCELAKILWMAKAVSNGFYSVKNEKLLDSNQNFFHGK